LALHASRSEVDEGKDFLVRGSKEGFVATGLQEQLRSPMGSSARAKLELPLDGCNNGVILLVDKIVKWKNQEPLAQGISCFGLLERWLEVFIGFFYRCFLTHLMLLRSGVPSIMALVTLLGAILSASKPGGGSNC